MSHSGACAPWLVLQHVAFEGPGLIAEEAAARGVALERRRLYRGEAPPPVEEIGGLVVMGGPMSVGDVGEHPYLAGERQLIAAAVERDLPMLGVCLGSQLLAAALGAEVRRGPVAEIGLGQVELTPAGERDPVLAAAGSPLPVFHWHGDTFDPPAGAPSLARSDLYPNQAFRAGRRALGLQFHVELDADLAAELGEHLPAGVELPPDGRRTVEAAGRKVIAAFFAEALN